MFHIISLPFKGCIEETFVSKEHAETELSYYKSKNVDLTLRVVSDDEYNDIYKKYRKNNNL